MLNYLMARRIDGYVLMQEYGESKIASGTRVDFWTEALGWYETNIINGKLYGENIALHYNYIEEAGGMLINRNRNDELEIELSVKMALMSPFHFYDYYNNQKKIRTLLQIEEATLDNSSDGYKLNSIDLPVLLIAGKSDMIAFESMSIDWFNQFPLPGQNTLALYENCGHAAFLDQPDLYVEDINSFISSLNF